jgi:dipeptidyl aminopeptidase/acylaminoacyl peptidase
VVAIAAGLDATRPYIDEAVDVQMALYGGVPSQTMPARLDASPLAQVSADSAPFLLFHGADDENTPVEQSRNMADALHRAGVEVVYVEYPHATHFYWISFFEITGSWDTVAPETLAFLGRHLAAPAN